MNSTAGEGTSGPCGKCKLCGNRDKKNWRSMVPETSEIIVIKIVIKIVVKCGDYGIYLVVCSIPGHRK